MCLNLVFKTSILTCVGVLRAQCSLRLVHALDRQSIHSHSHTIHRWTVHQQILAITCSFTLAYKNENKMEKPTYSKMLHCPALRATIINTSFAIIKCMLSALELSTHQAKLLLSPTLLRSPPLAAIKKRVEMSSHALVCQHFAPKRKFLEGECRHGKWLL